MKLLAWLKNRWTNAATHAGKVKHCDQKFSKFRFNSSRNPCGDSIHHKCQLYCACIVMVSKTHDASKSFEFNANSYEVEVVFVKGK